MCSGASSLVVACIARRHEEESIELSLSCDSLLTFCSECSRQHDSTEASQSGL